MEDNYFKGLVVFLFGLTFLYLNYIHISVSADVSTNISLLNFDKNAIFAFVLMFGGPIYYWYYKPKHIKK